MFDLSDCSVTSSVPPTFHRPNANSLLNSSEAEDADRAHVHLVRHVIPVRTIGGRPPLFCIFPGPPGSSEFAELLPDDQPLYDFSFVKFDGSVNFPTVEQLAETFLKEIRQIQPEGPYQLCGYSRAGLVAYEIARLLLSEGERVPFLALFETWHPGFEKSLTGIELVQFRALHLADRFRKYSYDLFRGRFRAVADLAWDGIFRRVKKVYWRMARKSLENSGQPVPYSMQSVEVIVVLKSFVPKPIPKRLILVRTDNSFEKRLRDKTLGWRVCAPEGVDVFFVAGDQDHGTMMNKPAVRAVIQRIEPYLVCAPSA